jgi:hypothetical protein
MHLVCGEAVRPLRLSEAETETNVGCQILKINGGKHPSLTGPVPVPAGSRPHGLPARGRGARG